MLSDMCRFITKFTIGKDIENGCWEWTSSLIKPFGYGRFNIGQGKRKAAHIVSYELFKGDVPEGMCVLHDCDNPCCVNPAHLFLGTRKDNNEDKMSKGRHKYSTVSNENHPSAILTDEQVADIRRLYATGTYSYGKLSSLYGTSRGNIAKIVTYKRRRLTE